MVPFCREFPGTDYQYRLGWDGKQNLRALRKAAISAIFEVGFTGHRYSSRRYAMTTRFGMPAQVGEVLSRGQSKRVCLAM